LLGHGAFSFFAGGFNGIAACLKKLEAEASQDEKQRCKQEQATTIIDYSSFTQQAITRNSCRRFLMERANCDRRACEGWADSFAAGQRGRQKLPSTRPICDEMRFRLGRFPIVMRLQQLPQIKKTAKCLEALQKVIFNQFNVSELLLTITGTYLEGETGRTEPAAPRFAFPKKA